MPAHDIDARRITIVGASLLLVVVLAVLAVFALLRHEDMPPGEDRVGVPYNLAMPSPALQSAPQIDLPRYRAEKQRILDGSGWVSGEHGVVRIPIATAMALLAHEPASAASAARAAR
jgi:hypothetical protein